MGDGNPWAQARRAKRRLQQQMIAEHQRFMNDDEEDDYIGSENYKSKKRK